MNYIIFDLEFNQGYKYRRKSKKNKRDLVNPRCPFEIIQIGAVKLDDNLELISTLDRLVKPEIYTNVHHFISEMTGITIDMLEDAKSFKDIYKEFVDFIGVDSVLCPWGAGDIRELIRNINFHGLDISLIPNLYIDVQKHASNHLNTPKGNCIGLENAAKALDIPIKNEFHDAFNDAFYTAEIFKKIYSKDISPSVYNMSENSGKNVRPLRIKSQKTKLDFDSLVKQFEKMYNKKMTKREKSIIKLAYTMGRTGQFQVDDSEE